MGGLGQTNAFLVPGLEEFEEKIEALGQQEEENKSETWISNLVKEYAKVSFEKYKKLSFGNDRIF